MMILRSLICSSLFAHLTVSSLADTDTASFVSLFEKASGDEFKHWLTSLRRDLHQTPELAFREVNTSEILKTRLDGLGVRYSTGWAKHPLNNMTGTGIVGDLGTHQHPCVLLRADIDALPIAEKSGVSFASTNGRMHACGHDAHATMMMGAVRLLKDMTLSGTVRFMLQPAEEGGAGAAFMIDEGVLNQHPRVGEAFGMHLFPGLPTGAIGSTPKTICSGTSNFVVTVTGKGGHAAMPYTTIDPIPVVAAIINGLYAVVSREAVGHPDVEALISVTSVEAGQVYNVIPETATIRGTIRALTTKQLRRLEDRARTLATHMAAAHNCNSTFEMVGVSYEPTTNDDALYQLNQPVAAEASSNGVYQQLPASFGGEDFGFISQKVPSCFFVIGSGATPETSHGLHSDKFAIDEDVLPRGSAFYAYLALKSLERQNQNVNTCALPKN